MFHDKIITDCIKKHFNWEYHLEDIILNNYKYLLSYFELPPKLLFKYTTQKEQSKYTFRNGLYYRIDFEGELDIGCIKPNQNYAFVCEVKSKDTHSNFKKACYQLLKDKEFIKDEYDIDRCFCFYVTKGKTKRVF